MPITRTRTAKFSRTEMEATDLGQVGLDECSNNKRITHSSSSTSSSDGESVTPSKPHVQAYSHGKASFNAPDPSSLDISTLIMTDEAQDEANLEGMGIILSEGWLFHLSLLN